MKKKIIKLIFIIIIIICIVLGAFFISGYTLYQDTIKENTIKDTFEEKRASDSYVEIEDLPDNFLDAVVAVEDSRYYNHGAVDYISIVRAMFNNVKENEIAEGGSTITQQVAKNLFYTQKKQLTRKIAEAFTANDLEQQFSKRDILEMYVNINYYGSGYYGIFSACKGYLKKDPEDMTLAECALLAGIPNSPNNYSPKNNKELSVKRQKVVLDRMLKNNYITQKEYDSAIEEIDGVKDSKDSKKDKK